MRRVLPVFSALLLLAYPFAVFFGLRHWGLTGLAPLLLALFSLRLLQRRPPVRLLAVSSALAALVGITLVLLAWLFRQNNWLLFYPVAVNALLFAFFASSLRRPPCVIERLARLSHPDLPEAGVRHTRRVTKVWCGFFLLNGATALFTALHGDLALWTLYNGAISYALMGILFAGEWLVRQKLLAEK